MRTRPLFGSLLAAVLLGGCALAEAPRQLALDAATTTTLKSRLATSEGMTTLFHVHVRTTDDMVRLTGSVPDEAARQRIDALARDVAGDNRVTNELTVNGVEAAAESN
jgi:osmotically-inducible protein OsmY